MSPAAGSLVTTARDTPGLRESARIIRSPERFDGAFDELCRRFILPDLPQPEIVFTGHELLAGYARGNIAGASNTWIATVTPTRIGGRVMWTPRTAHP